LNIQYLKIFQFLLVSAFVSLLCTSCCQTCLISNTELSSIDTGVYKSWKNVTTVTSNHKSIKIAPVIGGQIVSYSYSDDNILAPINPPFNPLPGGEQKEQVAQINITSAHEQKSIKFKDHCNYKVYEPNTVLLSNTINSHEDLKFLQKYRMNLENGDVFISQYLENSTEEQKSLYISNKTFFKPDGYVIAPLSVISKLPNKWCYLTKKTVNSEDNNSLQIFDDNLIFHTLGEKQGIVTDLISDWFAYIWKDLLFIKKFSYGSKGDYSQNYTVKINCTDSSVMVETPSPILNIEQKANKSFSQKWSIIKLNRSVNSIDEAIKAFNLVQLQLLLNR